MNDWKVILTASDRHKLLGVQELKMLSECLNASGNIDYPIPTEIALSASFNEADIIYINVGEYVLCSYLVERTFWTKSKTIQLGLRIISIFKD